MPTVTIKSTGERVPVESSFLRLPPAEQQRRVNEYVAGNPGALANLDPASVPPRNPPLPVGETAVNMAGEMLGGVPIAGPALQGLAARGVAAKQSLMGEKPYSQALEDVQTRQEVFRREHPVLSESAQAGGASLAAGAGGRALGLGAKTIPRQMAARGLTGGGVGAADAYVRGNDPKLGAIVGTTAGTVAGSLGPRAAKSIPADTMRQIRDQAYQTVDQIGAKYTPTAYATLVRDIMGKMRTKGLDPGLHTGAGSVMRRLPRTLPNNWATPGAPTLTNLDHLRQIVRRDTRGSLADEEMGDSIIASIDNFIDAAGPMQMAGMSGKGPVANAAILAARKAHSQYRKAELIETVLDRAKRAAAVSGTLESQTKRQINRILNDKDLSRGFTQAEMAQMRKIVLPQTKGEAFLQSLAEFSPTGSGWKAAGSLAAGTVDPRMWGLSAAGLGAKVASRGMTQGRSDDLQQLISRGGIAERPTSLRRQAVQAISLGVPLATYPELLEMRPDLGLSARGPKPPLAP